MAKNLIRNLIERKRIFASKKIPCLSSEASYLTWFEFSQSDCALKILEDSAQVEAETVVVAEGEARVLKVGADDRDFNPTNDRKFVGLLNESSSSLVESILWLVRRAEKRFLH